MFDAGDGIIAHLMEERGGDLHDRHVVELTSGSLERETKGANPHSGAFDSDPGCAAKNAADLEADSVFSSGYRERPENMPLTRCNWLCYDFKERRIVPTHRAIGTHEWGFHLKSWLARTSADEESWCGWTTKRTISSSAASRLRLQADGHIGANQFGRDDNWVSPREIFGILIE
jgi:hypothetical protein